MIAQEIERNASIRLQNVSMAIGRKQILSDISIAVPQGSIYGLLGPSGCGKTTTVKIVAGILEATAGEAWVLDEKMPNLDLMNRVGYMAQADALYPTLSARENMTFFGSVYGMSKELCQKRILETIRIVGLEKELDKPVLAYSGGMKRRLSLAMSLLHDPKVLILDEPTVGIDPLLRKGIWNTLYEIARAGTTILVTTHVMDEAEKCGMLAMMREGSLLAVGTPSEIMKKSGTDSLEAAFISYSTEVLK